MRRRRPADPRHRFLSRATLALVLSFTAALAACDLVQSVAAPLDAGTTGDSDSGIGEKGIVMDCGGCPSVGDSVEAMTCAIDLCDPDVVVSSVYESMAPMPSGHGSQLHRGCVDTHDTFEAVARFGDGANHLAPRLNDSYALMSTGRALSVTHDDSCWGDPSEATVITDPYREEECDGSPCRIYDAMEWTLTLKAPEEAKSFRLTYVFFSAEYDEGIGEPEADKFYVVLESPSNNDGAPEIINYTRCRDPDAAYDFVCQPGDYNCKQGDKYCYLNVNSALSECCWYPYGSVWASNPDSNPCPDGYSTTDISGTGFECAQGVAFDDSTSGSSTGWLQTAWPVKGGEEFKVTFHIHDAGDPNVDSTVLIDSFQFLKTPMTGTGILE